MPSEWTKTYCRNSPVTSALPNWWSALSVSDDVPYCSNDWHRGVKPTLTLPCEKRTRIDLINPQLPETIQIWRHDIITLFQVHRLRSEFLKAVLRQDISWYDGRKSNDFASTFTEWVTLPPKIRLWTHFHGRSHPVPWFCFFVLQES